MRHSAPAKLLDVKSRGVFLGVASGWWFHFVGYGDSPEIVSHLVGFFFNLGNLFQMD